MNAEDTRGNQNWNSQLSQRAAKLSERGAHYFVGWLIGTGMDKPEIATEFEKVLHQLESDPKLQYCWRESDRMGDVPVSAEQATFSIYQEQPAIPSEAVPCLAEEEPAQKYSGNRMAPVETKPDRSPEFAAGFFGRLFRRQRIAA